MPEKLQIELWLHESRTKNPNVTTLNLGRLVTGNPCKGIVNLGDKPRGVKTYTGVMATLGALIKMGLRTPNVKYRFLTGGLYHHVELRALCRQ